MTRTTLRQRPSKVLGILWMGNTCKARFCNFAIVKVLDECLGNPTNMPPETLRDNPNYGVKYVLIAQSLTQLFSQLDDTDVTLQDGRYGGAVLMSLLPEVERRKNHDDPGYFYLQVTYMYPKTERFERPSAQQLCESVGVLKEMRLYRESEMFGNKSCPQNVPSKSMRPEFQLISIPMIQIYVNGHKQSQKCEEKSAEICAFYDQMKKTAMLIEDIHSLFTPVKVFDNMWSRGLHVSRRSKKKHTKCINVVPPGC